MALPFDESLIERLTTALPKDLRFTVHHVYSRPTICDAIFSSPEGEAPEETRRESHILSVSVNVNGAQIQAFAVEVLIYSTETLTTLFVSKADSTGYLHTLDIAKGTPSPIRTVISTFLTLLVQRKRRDGVRLVVSLFARAQDQYLFPGSIENSSKHVLDDRGLIRWWCKVLDIVLEECLAGVSHANGNPETTTEKEQFISHGYLRVPGCDAYETKTFLPRRDTANGTATPRWLPSDPLRALGKPPILPERCLIPRFPDDPKTRLVIDLDDELEPNASQVEASPTKRSPGKWRSVKNLEEFWEMMAFRQECAAGRLVGFIWGVFTPSALVDRPFSVLKDITEGENSKGVISTEDPSLPTPAPSQTHDDTLIQPLSPIRSSSPSGGQVLTPLPSSQLQPVDAQPDTLVLSQEERFAGVAIDSDTKKMKAALELTESAYTRVIDLLARLDYANETLAAESTQEWVSTVAKEAGVNEWGLEVVGMKNIQAPCAYMTEGVEGAISTLGPMLIRKKRKSGVDTVEAATGAEGVKILSAGLVRKKPKMR